ncbi:FecR domain-containing protein [Chitinophaga horti]|uniref:FecR domain-containing protein n=1 Tax=Chitinophaga horti TaxID=2920382 RepID=A0ABY6J4L4_9BACT|nr:FecR family protein [Chitinophaga horti]UYQ94306.1 FecR domain-containing protein [Chitinophaga horti]
MTDNTPAQRIAYLLEQYSKSLSSEAEAAELEAVLQDDQRRNLVIDVLTDMAGRTETHAPLSPAQLETGLQSILNKPRLRVASRKWLVAASIALLLTAGGATYFLVNRSTPTAPPVVKAHQIVPGHNGAVLTLANGEQVVLDSLGNGVVAMQGNSAINKQNGQLVYGEGGDVKALNTISTPRGRRFSIVLPDGTKVWLNAASSLRFPTAFAAGGREVDVTGEAYFEVAKQAASPFRVRINPKTKVEVLGTAFNISAYADDKEIRTTLVQGAVKLNDEVLKPGEQARINDAGTVNIVANADIEAVTAWKNGTFLFRNRTPLTEVMRQLARWYDIEVIYPQGEPTMVFTGEMQQDLSFDQAMKGLAAMGVNFSIEGKKVYVHVK